MPTVIVDVIAPQQSPAAAYERISDFSRYVELTDTVREVKLHAPAADGSMSSDWTVKFRNGLLRWSELDVFDPVVIGRVAIVHAGLGTPLIWHSGRYLRADMTSASPV